MRRRLLITALGFVLGVPQPLLAQPTGEVRRIGYLAINPAKTEEYSAFLQRLKELGYTEGRNLLVERRVPAGKETFETLARDLVHSKVDLIVAVATPSAQAARHATSSIPIVFVAVVDPVGAGLTGNLARPDGNATGLSTMAAELAGKRLELLREIVPGLTRVAVLGNANNPSNAIQSAQMRDAAAKMNVHAESLQVKSRDELEGAVAAASRQHADALIVLDDTLLVVEQPQVAALAGRHRVPLIYGVRRPGAGVLVSYGPNFTEHYRRAAAYVARILKGATPAELPVEQPTRFELVLDLSAARTLGLKIPHSVLLRADRVIE